jgi:hypothetical protein
MQITHWIQDLHSQVMKITTFEEVKYEIFQGLGFEQSQYSIDIQCRVNIAPMGYFYFNLIRIYDESSWKITSQMAISKMRIVRLYVRMNHA